jgi:PAS domain S-box-containing protein
MNNVDADRDRLRRVLRVVLTATMVVSVTGILMGILVDWVVAPWVGAAGIVIALASYFVARGGFEIAAAVITLTFITLATGVLAWSGDGIHDVIIVAFSAIIIIANLIGHRVATAFTVLAVIAPIGVALSQQLTGAAHVFGGDEVPELFVLIVTLALIAISTRMLTGDLSRSLSRARESEGRYRGIFAGIQDTYYEIDDKGTILEISPSGEQLLKERRENLIGRSFEAYYVDPVDHTGMIAALRSRGRVENHESVLADTEGNEHLVLISASRLEGDDERFVGSIRDITTRRELEERLSQAQKMESIGTLAGGIAHDFNNLLTVINGHSELALMKLQAARQDVEPDMEAVRAAGIRAAELTAQLLTFSRRQVVQPEILDLNVIVGNLQRVIKPLLGEDITIDFDLAGDLPPILADSGQIEQVFINLLANARDAINQAPADKHSRRIGVTTSLFEGVPACVTGEIVPAARGYISLSVSDTGAGMDPEVRRRIFEPFFTTKEQGTGLGMATVYGIARQNNACIEIESREGEGSTITVYWPVSEGVILAPALHDGEIPRGFGSILVVEDEEAVRQVASEALSANGYTVTEADNGQQALQLLDKQQFNLIITDIVMPVMGGQDLADEVRKKNPSAKILFVSGYSEDRIGNSRDSAPDAPLLRKPYTIGSLLMTVRSMLVGPR